MLARIALLLLIPLNPAMASNLPQLPRQEDLNAKLRMSVHNYEIRANNILEALTRVGSEFQIPMGIAWVSSPSTQANVKLSWENATVGEVLQGIANTKPSLRMIIGHSIVHFLGSDLPPATENPLRIEIKMFDVKNEPVEFASRRLRGLAKLKVSPTKPDQRTGGGVAGSLFTNLDEPKISLQLRDVSLEDCLDVLATSSARKIWVVTFSPDRRLTPTGFRRTLTLWNDFPVGDNEQPIWDLLHWGDQLRIAQSTK